MDGSYSTIRRDLVSGLLGVVALGLSACGAGQSDRTLEEFPRIVSLNPCTDAILAEIADPAQILALSHYSHEPESTSMALEKSLQYRAISGTVEEVSALDPDMILASSFMPPASAKALDDLGFTSEKFGIASDVESSFAQIRKVANIAGHPQRGEALITQITDAIRDAKKNAAHTRPDEAISAVLWQPGEIVPGDQALIGQLMQEAGFSNHSAAIGLGQADYLSLEAVLANPPDLLLIAGSSRGQQHPALKQLTQTKVERLDPSMLYCAGPTIIRTVERLAEIRQKFR